MYLSYEELKVLDPSIKVTAEEWTAMSLQIDAMVDRLTFDVIGQRSVMSIPTLADKVKRAVAVEARTIVTRGGHVPRPRRWYPRASTSEGYLKA